MFGCATERKYTFIPKQHKTTKETNRFSDARAFLGFRRAFLFIIHGIFIHTFSTRRILLFTRSRFFGLIPGLSFFSFSPLSFSFLCPFFLPESGPGCSTPRPGLFNRKWNRTLAFPLQTEPNKPMKNSGTNKSLVTHHVPTVRKGTSGSERKIAKSTCST